MTIKLVVFGAQGRMGELICELASENEKFELSGLVDIMEGKLKGIEITPPEKAKEEFETADVVVEFSSPKGLSKALEIAIETETPIVSGTTGISDRTQERIREASQKIPVVRSSNFASGTNVFWSLVEKLAEMLPEYDFEVTETHHRHKKDSPSGTAMETVRRIEKGIGKGKDRVYGRKGEMEREDEIGIHARRAGEIVGEHEVLAAADGEEIVINHRSESRRSFASGALRAALFAAKKEQGLYGVDDILSSPS